LLDHNYAAHVLRIPVESQQNGNEFTVIHAMRSKQDDQETSKPLYTLVRTPKGTCHWCVCYCGVELWPCIASFGL